MKNAEGWAIVVDDGEIDVRTVRVILLAKFTAREDVERIEP